MINTDWVLNLKWKKRESVKQKSLKSEEIERKRKSNGNQIMEPQKGVFVFFI